MYIIYIYIYNYSITNLHISVQCEGIYDKESNYSH